MCEGDRTSRGEPCPPLLVLDTISDLVGKVEKRARTPWITQEMISKMYERRKWKNVNTEEGRRNYRDRGTN